MLSNLKAGNIENFISYSQFNSLKEFNNHIEMWLVDHKKDFSKSELIGFKRLVRFSAKVPGVCNAKIGTILKAIYEEYGEHGISRSTFKRMVKKAKSLGILTTYETERKNGSQTSNLYIFHRYPERTGSNVLPTHEPPMEEIMNLPKETINLRETNNINNNKRSDDLDHTYTSEAVPSSFITLIRTFFDCAKTIEEYWRMTKIAAYEFNFEKNNDLMLRCSIQAFKQMMNKLKKGRVKKAIAYYFGVLKKKFMHEYFSELYEDGFGVA